MTHEIPLIWDERLTEEDRPLVADFNAVLERLASRRAVQINVAGPFARSKIAWKLAVYEHALLYRIVALIGGTAIAWNSRCALPAMLSARALMETIAIMARLAERVTDLLAQKDLRGLNAFAMGALYASRDASWVAEFPETKAVNVQTYIDKFDKGLRGFREHYDRLSERCHPNAGGHNFMFATLDRSDGTVRFCEERNPDRNGQAILAALAPVELVESMMSRLDELIVKVSDLHHRTWPVGGPESPADASSPPPQA